MTTIFFGLAFYFIIQEILVSLNPWKAFVRTTFRDNYTSMKAEATTPELIENLKTFQRVCAKDTLFFGLPYFIWTVIGLWSSQWIYFGCLLLLANITRFIYKRIGDPNRQVSILRADAIVSILILIIILVNHF